ncbi:MAG TPA: IS200/IS605 family transposase [Blastocatellia bacterium]|nr:IS200/IS605 family transposase [Blastocatellia bacterium]
MANTYTQIYIQLVFAVSGLQCLISEEFKEELYKYIGGIIRNEGQKLIAINGMPDHAHILIGLKPDMAVSTLVKAIKSSSSNFINSKRWVRGRFSWQEGFGAFSYPHSQLGAVARYVENQKASHAKKSFKEEYLELLRKFEIAYDDKYLFNWIEQAGPREKPSH